MIPPLRERPEDIPALVHHFLRRHAERDRTDVLQVSPDAMARLAAHDWRGNVRELSAVVERLVLRRRGAVVIPEHLPEALYGQNGAVPVGL